MLLVEDDAMLAEALSRALRGLGHEVAVAATGVEALVDRRTPMRGGMAHRGRPCAFHATTAADTLRRRGLGWTETFQDMCFSS